MWEGTVVLVELQILYPFEKIVINAAACQLASDT